MPELKQIAERVLAGEPLDRDTALWVAGATELEELLFWANFLRESFCGNVVHLCSIINARSGACAEDCKFCAQSAHHHTEVKVYPLLPEAQTLDAAQQARQTGADSFGIVTSGGSLCENAEDFAAVCHAARQVQRTTHLSPCVSIGRLTPQSAAQLIRAGVRRVNHNLETSKRFYPEICTTHAYAQRVETVKAAKEAGLQVCCGGIFGMGESWQDRVDLALQIRELQVDAVPINFLNPIPGTPLAGQPTLPPREALRIIALYRFLLPEKEIKVCGGREVTLRDLQSWMFLAGASGTMVGSYLTTAGRSADDDLQMIADLGLRPRSAVP